MYMYIYISTCRRKQRPAGLSSWCSDLGGESGSLVTWFFLQQPPRRLFLIHILSLEHLWRQLLSSLPMRQRGNRDVFFVVFPSGQGAGTPSISFSFQNTKSPGGFPPEMPAQYGCVILPLPQCIARCPVRRQECFLTPSVSHSWQDDDSLLGHDFGVELWLSQPHPAAQLGRVALSWRLLRASHPSTADPRADTLRFLQAKQMSS